MQISPRDGINADMPRVAADTGDGYNKLIFNSISINQPRQSLGSVSNMYSLGRHGFTYIYSAILARHTYIRLQRVSHHCYLLSYLGACLFFTRRDCRRMRIECVVYMLLITILFQTCREHINTSADSQPSATQAATEDGRYTSKIAAKCVFSTMRWIWPLVGAAASGSLGICVCLNFEISF